MTETQELQIVGRAITAIRFLTPAELEAEGWDSRAAVEAIELDGGIIIFASCDDEGNQPGAIFGRWQGDAFYVHPGTLEQNAAS